jgi:hypothetical protein
VREPRCLIGRSPTLQWQRLALIANNSRFLILPGVRVKNLASRILGLMGRRGQRHEVSGARRLAGQGPQ